MTEADFREIARCRRAFGSWPSDLVATEILKNTDIEKIRTSLHVLLHGDGPLEEGLNGCKIRFLGTSSITEIMEPANPKEHAP